VYRWLSEGTVLIALSIAFRQEHSTAFLNKVKKHEAPDYYTGEPKSTPNIHREAADPISRVSDHASNGFGYFVETS
jgi:hypothetical protein